jgi:long-subunit fatty acid transport protein
MWFSFAVVPTSGAKGSIDRMVDLNIMLEDDGDPLTEDPAVRHLVNQSVDIQQVALEPSLAWQLSPDFSFGFGLSLRTTTLNMSGGTDSPFSDLKGFLPDDDPLRTIFGYDTWGDALEGFLSGGDRAIDDYHVDFLADASNAAMQVFLKFGGAWQVNPQTRLGFWYRPMSNMSDIVGQTTVDMSADLGAFTSVLEDMLGLEDGYYLDDPTSDFDFRVRDIRLPQQAGLSTSSQLNNGDIMHFSAVWTDWSQSFDGWVATLSNPSNEQFAGFIGGDGTLTMDMDMKWRDTVSMSLGWERNLSSQLTLRSGLGWSRNPMQGSWMASSTPFNELHLAGGLAYRASSKGMPDFFISTVIALPQKENAGENLVLSDLSGDRYSQWHGSLALGLSWRW